MKEYQNKYARLVNSLPNYYNSSLDTPNKYESMFSRTTDYVVVGISDPSLERELSHLLADRFNKNTNIYDKAIDSKYLETGIGGSKLHHNLDGNHTFRGAIEALREAFPEESVFQHSLNALEHLARDLTTPSGINPFLDPGDFQKWKDYLVKDVGVSSSYANDLLNFNAVEVAGAVIASLGIALSLSSTSISRIGNNISRLSLCSFFAANPALMLVAAASIGMFTYRLLQGESILDGIIGAGEGLVSASTFLIVTAYTPGPVFIGLISGMAACWCVSRLYNKVINFFKEDFDDLLQKQFNGYRSYYLFDC